MSGVTSSSARTPTRTRLSDGRELLYFDDLPGVPHDAVDQRNLQAPVNLSQARWDVLTREWTVIAGHRQQRTFRPSTQDCPLCPSRDGALTEVPQDRYDVVVFENRFPSLSASSAREIPVHDELPFRSGPGLGRCEVVVFTDDHTASFASLSQERVETVIDAWIQRTTELRARDDVGFVYCFENRGDEIGVTLAHPHGQIYAYPFVPTRIARTGRSFLQAVAAGQDCLQCSLIEAELADGRRIVAAGEHWLAYVPFAARWPYEVRVVPRRHLGTLPELTDAEQHELARLYLDVLGRFDRLWDSPAPYIAGWDQAPVGPLGQAWHLSADVFTIQRARGKLKYLAGSESGAGVWVNDVAPETAAARLRGERG
ncbi:MAG: galactose-1-phosphate uridylyltransferase [Actinomycetota bacterium]|nr:galactose-1-phosphate uridylyltransferase [Actinomycetota bacterium]MDQ2958540.1 galactose-1-phosphate uridylyltransferase [Actinomycetota bacterium]